MNFVQYSFNKNFVKRKKAEFHVKNCLAKNNFIKKGNRRLMPDQQGFKKPLAVKSADKKNDENYIEVS
jgi:hypothetical protein